MSDEGKCSGSEASSPTKQSAQQPDSLIAYVHNLSPIRRNRENTKDYSTLTLQTSSGRNEQALLFSKHKRKLLQDHETSRIPVKFQKLAKTKDGKKLIINEITEITAPRPEEYSFQFENLLSSTSVVSLNSIQNLAEGTEVIVKGKVHSMGEPYTIGAKQLQVCEVLLGDETGVAKCDVWENYIPKFEVGHCYTISPVQVRSWLGNKKFSTLVYSNVVEVKDEVLLKLEAPIDKAEETNMATVRVQCIDSIDKIETFIRCEKCGKKVLQPSDSFVAHCDYCGRHMRIAKCKKDVCVRFVVEIGSEDVCETLEIGSSNEDVKKLSLTAFDNSLSAVCCDLPNLSSDKDIALALFALKDIYIKYNCSTMIVSSIF